MNVMQQSIQRAREMREGARRIVVFTGAGVSADSGVPTFRGAAGQGFWGKYDPAQLATPQGFAADPQLVYDWYNWRRTQVAQIQPNAAHITIATLQRQGAVVITQNIDGLHERVAPDGAVIHRLHGTLAADRCSSPRCMYTEDVSLASPPPLRHCPRCGKFMRPAVVWFGESLETAVWHAAESATEACDVLLVVGTSGEVYPAAGLVHLAKSRRAGIILVNLEPGTLDDLADVALHGRAADMVPQIVQTRIEN